MQRVLRLKSLKPREGGDKKQKLFPGIGKSGAIQEKA
jgi:hypothetical protein